MTLLAVFQTLLYRYTGEEDILVGTPIDLTRVIKMNKPHQRVRYELQEIGQPTLRDILMQKFGEKK